MDTLNIDSIKSYASSLANSQATSSMTNRAKEAQTDEELMDACKEFESYLWEQVLKSMKSTVDVFGDDESGSNSQLVDYFMDNTISDLASQMTEKSAGPTSLAQQMYEQMKRTSTIDVEKLLAEGNTAVATDDGDN